MTLCQERLRYELMRRSVRLGFLTVKWIDLTSGQHVGKHEILEDLYPLLRSSFVVVTERLEEVLAGFVPLPYREMGVNQ